ncbi:GNAT family N-acetyltransferase [Micromonospora sp. 4G57]|uniref:GNAT family N-acetyltransferase n=1 Tax=Micromonospora sicca TaxID=2202420 RepID=A0ABU5JLY0_9ACTN|nr:MULTISPECIES: GNAT family N-acetyltransferase [unclassified Micromonospora]MDZ5446955.1 GNAT family N-acetyltransferase [Micromonospora sp. 4G57]MDZ5493632.1 GNAT family N-acetyltransferase [Micromonospora sp. 4G53]
MSTRVTDNVAESRFEIFDGEELAGFAQYHRFKDEVAFIHTEVDDRFAGRGLAGTLVEAALTTVREQNLKVLPYCPFVRNWITKHPEFKQLVPLAQRPRFGF